jgi:hypothetical protein
MKNILIITALFLLGTFAQAAVKTSGNAYVKSGDKIFFGQDLRIGLFHYRVKAMDGTVVKISNRDVDTYMVGSKLYERLPVVINGRVQSHAMMECISVRNDLKLYRYNDYDGVKATSHYFVFRDGVFHLKVDNKNAATIFPFFGINKFRVS